MERERLGLEEGWMGGRRGIERCFERDKDIGI